MALQDLITAFQDKLKFGGITGKTLKIEVEDEGSIYIDTQMMPYQITENLNADADVTMIAKREVFLNILSGVQDPNMAFMMGKLQIKGSMGLAMKIAAVLED